MSRSLAGVLIPFVFVGLWGNRALGETTSGTSEGSDVIWKNTIPDLERSRLVQDAVEEARKSLARQKAERAANEAAEKKKVEEAARKKAEAAKKKAAEKAEAAKKANHQADNDATAKVSAEEAKRPGGTKIVDLDSKPKIHKSEEKASVQPNTYSKKSDEKKPAVETESHTRSVRTADAAPGKSHLSVRTSGHSDSDHADSITGQIVGIMPDAMSPKFLVRTEKGNTVQVISRDPGTPLPGPGQTISALGRFVGGNGSGSVLIASELKIDGPGSPGTGPMPQEIDQIAGPGMPGPIGLVGISPPGMVPPMMPPGIGMPPVGPPVMVPGPPPGF